jgi:pSer/pThr/pTyr-binding forkhead associated (FHA) protein
VLAFAALALGALVGFVGSRKLRRPQAAAQAASVARSVGGNLGRRRGLSAPELQRACFSEMVRHVRVDRDGRSTAPARYQLQLHPDDLAVVDETRQWFTDGLVDALRQAAADNGWALAGTVDVTYEADPSRRPGVPTPRAGYPPAPGRAARAAAPAAAPPVRTRGRGPAVLAVRRADTGEQIALTDGAISIGRATERGIVIDDSRVSRDHAVLAPGRAGWTITDRGSANGTVHNGRLLTPRSAQALAVGDAIGIGPVELLVVEVADDRPAPGSRALDDRERTRISGEVLPPPRRPRS